MKTNLKIFFLLVAAFCIGFISGCQKQPGDGGLATIHGHVYAYKKNAFGQVIDSGYRSGVTVYLSYGSHTWEDQNNKSSYTGEYAFPYLHTGDYSVYVIKKCDTCPLSQSYDIVHLTINGARETVEVRNLINYY